MTTPDDPYDLHRFVDAQSTIFEQALSEIRSGRKRSHWMWFIFPQFRGLGSSPTSQHYAIASLAEAEAYLRHPILGPRLQECVKALLALEETTASEIFGYPDDLKLRSSATLFAHVSPRESPFEQLLERYFGGEPDSQTIRLIRERA